MGYRPQVSINLVGDVFPFEIIENLLDISGDVRLHVKNGRERGKSTARCDVHLHRECEGAVGVGWSRNDY